MQVSLRIVVNFARCAVKTVNKYINVWYISDLHPEAEYMCKGLFKLTVANVNTLTKPDN